MEFIKSHGAIAIIAYNASVANDSWENFRDRVAQNIKHMLVVNSLKWCYIERCLKKFLRIRPHLQVKYNKDVDQMIKELHSSML